MNNPKFVIVNYHETVERNIIILPMEFHVSVSAIEEGYMVEFFPHSNHERPIPGEGICVRHRIEDANFRLLDKIIDHDIIWELLNYISEDIHLFISEGIIQEEYKKPIKFFDLPRFGKKWEKNLFYILSNKKLIFNESEHETII